MHPRRWFSVVVAFRSTFEPPRRARKRKQASILLWVGTKAFDDGTQAPLPTRTPRALSQAACVPLLLSRAECFGGLKSLSSGVSSGSYHLEKPDSFTSDMFGVGAGNEPSDSPYNMPVKKRVITNKGWKGRNKCAEKGKGFLLSFHERRAQDGKAYIRKPHRPKACTNRIPESEKKPHSSE